MIGSNLVMGTRYEKMVENMHYSVAKIFDMYIQYDMELQAWFLLHNWAKEQNCSYSTWNPSMAKKKAMRGLLKQYNNVWGNPCLGLKSLITSWALYNIFKALSQNLSIEHLTLQQPHNNEKINYSMKAKDLCHSNKLKVRMLKSL